MLLGIRGVGEGIGDLNDKRDMYDILRNIFQAVNGMQTPLVLLQHEESYRDVSPEFAPFAMSSASVEIRKVDREFEFLEVYPMHSPFGTNLSLVLSEMSPVYHSILQNVVHHPEQYCSLLKLTDAHFARRVFSVMASNGPWVTVTTRCALLSDAYVIVMILLLIRHFRNIAVTEEYAQYLALSATRLRIRRQSYHPSLYEYQPMSQVVPSMRGAMRTALKLIPTVRAMYRRRRDMAMHVLVLREPLPSIWIRSCIADFVTGSSRNMQRQIKGPPESVPQFMTQFPRRCRMPAMYGTNLNEERVQLLLDHYHQEVVPTIREHATEAAFLAAWRQYSTVANRILNISYRPRYPLPTFNTTATTTSLLTSEHAPPTRDGLCFLDTDQNSMDKCEMDPITMDEIPRRNLIRLKCGEAIQCFDVVSLYTSLRYSLRDGRPLLNPINRQPFSRSQLEYIERKYQEVSQGT